jgi:hypothetical protein
MSQMPPSLRSRTAVSRTRVSWLAITALVLAVIPCCPFVSLLGGMLGMVAVRHIGLSGGRLSGRKVAIAAATIGVGVTFVSSVVFNSLQQYADRTTRATIITQVEATVRDAADGRTGTALGRWQTDLGASRALTEDSIERFGRFTRDRYGELQRFTITSMVTSHNIFSPQIEVAGIFVFESRELTGSATFQLESGSSAFWPNFWLRKLVIDDPRLGALQLPEP